MSDILNVPELGELEIVEIYDYFNVPILFSCQNAVSHLYMVIFADYSSECETWLYVEVSPMRLNLIRSGKVNLHDAFSKPEMGRLLKAMIPHNNSGELNSEYITPDQLHSDVFPPVNEYLNLEDTPLSSETNLVEIAKSSGQEEQETPVTVAGELVGISLSNNRFEIQTENETYKGFILKDADSSIKNATMSRRYKAQIKEILNKSEGTDEIVKTEYLLLKLEEVGY